MINLSSCQEKKWKLILFAQTSVTVDNEVTTSFNLTTCRNKLPLVSENVTSCMQCNILRV